jgi:putative transposase
MKKLGISGICRTTVINILKENQFDPKTDAGKGSGAQFLRSHAQSLWQCDFFSKNIITSEGVRQCFVLAFLHVSSRRVWVSPATFSTTATWMRQQAGAFVSHVKAENLPASLVLLDRDCAYGERFLGTLVEAGVKPHRVCFKSPNLNAYVERFVQSRSAWTSSSCSGGSTWTTSYRSTWSTTTTSGHIRAWGTGR